MTKATRTRITSLLQEAFDTLEKSGVKPGTPEQTARAAIRQALETLKGDA